MCGIAGIYAYHPAGNGVDRNELIAIRDRMAPRGPDGSGVWVSENERVGLAHRRLAIIDLSDNGLQPMQTEEGRYIITFNGEIYNYAILREELRDRGYKFRTQSDTEVLLHLFADRGANMVRDLRGMFAFAIWDRLECTILLARDPYGIKPLYYSDDGKTCRFASQVKALLAGGKISSETDPAGLAGFYLFGSVPEPLTTWRTISSVPAGSTILIDRSGAGSPRSYHSIAAVYQDQEKASEDPETIRDALLDSVRSHLVADVPVGAFLSAGIDSGALVGLMRDAGQDDIETVTLSFDEFRGRADDESPLAEKVAELYGTRHTRRIVTEQEFHADLPQILHAMDQPTVDGINTWFVSKAAHELGLKVAVSGLGGDELFGGYPSFKDIPRWVRWLTIPSSIPRLGALARWAITSSGLNALGINPKAAGIFEYGGSYAGAYLLRRGLFMPWELEQVMGREMAELGLRRLEPLTMIERAVSPVPDSPFATVATLESSLYMRNQLLRDADWASMAHSLEVRVPLVDTVLLKRIAAMPVGTKAGKRCLAEAPSIPLPSAIAQRKKTGFTTPIATWLQRNPQLQRGTSMRASAVAGCHWSRKWAHSIAVA